MIHAIPMKTLNTSSSYTWYSVAAVSYLVSIIAASVCFSIQYGVLVIFHGFGQQPVLESLASLPLFLAIVSIMFWAAAVVYGSAPIALAVIVARRFGVASLAYYVIAYLMAAAIGACFVAGVSQSRLDGRLVDWQTAIHFFKLAALPALSGALALWLLLRRYT